MLRLVHELIVPCHLCRFPEDEEFATLTKDHLTKGECDAWVRLEISVGASAPGFYAVFRPWGVHPGESTK